MQFEKQLCSLDVTKTSQLTIELRFVTFSKPDCATSARLSELRLENNYLVIALCAARSGAR